MKKLIYLFALLCAVAASGQDKERARGLFKAGTAAYQAAQYQDAADRFEEAYKAFPSSEIAFSAAQAHRLQYGLTRNNYNLKRAWELYGVYKNQEPKGKRIGTVTEHMANLSTDVERLRTSGQWSTIRDPRTRVDGFYVFTSVQADDAKVRVDKGDWESLPLRRESKPGKYSLEVQAPGFENSSKEITVIQGGGFLPIEMTLTEKPAQITLNTSGTGELHVDGKRLDQSVKDPVLLDSGVHVLTVTRRGHVPVGRELEVTRDQRLNLDLEQPITGQRKASYWAFGAAGVALVGAGVMGGLAWSSGSKASDINDKRNTQGVTAAEWNEYLGHRDDYFSRRNWAFGLGSVALAGALVGGGLYWFDTPDPSEARIRKVRPQVVDDDDDVTPIVRVSPTIGNDMAGILLSGRF